MIPPQNQTHAEVALPVVIQIFKAEGDTDPEVQRCRRDPTTWSDAAAPARRPIRGIARRVESTLQDAPTWPAPGLAANSEYPGHGKYSRMVDIGKPLQRM